MSRIVRRVPLDFNWPMRRIWPGFCSPLYCVQRDYNFTDEEIELYAKITNVEYQDTPPPEGEGWQMWEDVSEGSPISPVFATKEELAKWLSENATGVDKGATYENWMAMIDMGWCPSGIFMPSTGYVTGVKAASLLKNKETT